MKPTLSTVRAALCRFLIPAVSLAPTLDASAHGSAGSYLGIDADDNHISDLWEAMYPGSGLGTADNDADGMTNAAEAAAGTNPNSSTDNLNFSSVTNTGAAVQTNFRSVAGKTYQLQSAAGLTGTWASVGTVLQGDGAVLGSSLPATGTRIFLRIQVSDQDSDSDGVTDWEEIQAGTNRYMWDTDGDGFSDRSYVEALLAGSSMVNIYAADTSANEGGTATFRVTRQGGFLPLTIPFSTAGSTAVAADYNLFPANSIVLPAGVRSGLITMTALPDAETEDAETVIVTLQTGAGYALGGGTAATVTIVSPGITGEYFNASGTLVVLPAVDPVNFTGPPALTRKDPTIDFDWLGVAPPPLDNDDVWVARWQGFIIPKYSELYQIHAIADRGVIVYVSPAPITGAAGQVRITQPTTTNPTTKYSANALTGTTPLVAGQMYYLRVDYRDSATNPNNANIQIRWSSPSQPEEVIPTGNLTSDNFGGAIPVITSPLFTTAISGAPLTYQITATNTPTTYTASGLPTGLSVNAAGLISGTLSATAGYHFTTLTAGNAAGSDSKLLVFYIATTGGGITRDVWTSGLTGTGVLSVPLHTPPSSTSTVNSLAAPDNDGEQFGERLRGYITAPVTGLYTFFLTTDENAELWISASDEPARKLKRSFLTNGSVSPGVWDASTTQRSLSMRMTGARKYFVEVIRRETIGADHLQIGWLKPGESGTSPSGIVPGWALSPFTAPQATSADGFLYAAVLTPQNGVSSLGTGSALLRVNADKTGADLTVAWGNLTGPVNNSHIHDSRGVPGPTGAIIFDIDDADPDRLLPGGDGLDPTEVYHWDIIGTGQHTYADVVAAIEGGTAYLNLHTAAYPMGEIKGFFAPVIGSQFFVPPGNPPAAELTFPADPTARKKEIVRFMQQATFGAAPDRDGATDASPANAPFSGWQPDSIEAVEALGYAAWVDAQLAMSPGSDPEIIIPQPLPPTTVYQASSNGRRTPNFNMTEYNGSGPVATLIRQYYERYPRSALEPNGAVTESGNEIWRSWWKLSSTAPDQLRHRVAFALSQILVVSEDGEFDERARWIGHYYDLLYYYGLDNFRTLLEKVTLNPSMGGYLDMLNNQKANPATGYIPNENYAREIMQLFAIGLRRLHPDGTLVLDSSGLPVPTYFQDNVVGLASTLTGWQLTGGGGNWIRPMTVTSASRHDFTEKLLLDEAVITASPTQTIAQCDLEFDQSHDLLFHHPNTGTFICRQLIQRMVTANPSPGYIYRVSKLFTDNGSGVRGDMKTVVKAILLDPEARNASFRTQPGFGHLKEPVVRATQFIRAFRGYSLAESKPEWANAIDLGTAIFSPAVHVDLTQPLPQRTNRWPDPAGSNSATRTLTVAIAATPDTGSLTVTLSGTAGAVINGDYIRIDSETFLVTAGGGSSSLTADRAQLGTVAAAHNSGATVFRLRPYNDNYIDEMLDPDGTGPLGLTQFSLILQPNNLILLRRQTTGASGTTANGETVSPENGAYTVTADAANPGRLKLVRAANADTGPEVTKAFIMVSTSRRDDGGLSGNRIYHQQLPVATIDTSPQYWVNQGQTNVSKGTAHFSPATDVTIATGFASTTGTNRTATLTENIGGTNYPFTISSSTTAGNNVLLLRRQSANAGYIDADGNTSSPENGLYTVTNDPGNAARVILVRSSNTNTAAEMLNASVSVTQMRMDDGTLYPPVAFTTAEQPSRTFRQELTVTILGTDPVRWAQQVPGGGTNLREAWGIGSTGSTTFSQTPLRSPTVFNFYEPGYVFLGNTGDSGLYAPEFQITTETSVINSANWYVDLTRRNSTNASTQASPFSYGQGFSYGDPFKKDVKLDLTTERTLANNTSALLDHLSIMLMPNQMTPRFKTLLQGFLDTQTTATSDADRMNRLGEVLYLISLSPEFTVQQ